MISSSHWSVCLVHGAEAWVPCCCFLCPSFIWKRCNSRYQTPFPSSVCFSIAVAVLLITCSSIQSSSSISSCVNLLIGVFHEGEMSLSWSQSVFESAASPSELLCFVFCISSIFLALAGLSFLFVFPSCLNDEAKHFALSRSYYSFVVP